MKDKNCEEAKNRGNKALQEHRESQSEKESEIGHTMKKGKKLSDTERLYPTLEESQLETDSEQEEWSEEGEEELEEEAFKSPSLPIG